MTQPVTPRYAREVGTASWGAVLQARKNGVEWNELRTDSGLSALGRAVVDNEPLIVEHLLDLGAPPTPVMLFNGTWFSPLWASLEREDPKVLHLLLKYGANPNESNPDDSFLKPLHQASEMRQIEATLYLCYAGANPDGWLEKDLPTYSFLKQYPTPLSRWVRHLANQFDNIDPFMALLNAGANPTLPAPPHQNLWQLVQHEWASALAQKNKHPHVGVAVSALEKVMLEWEMPDGKEGKGNKRL